jgi:hypothetical protein
MGTFPIMVGARRAQWLTGDWLFSQEWAEMGTFPIMVETRRAQWLAKVLSLPRRLGQEIATPGNARL